MQIPTPVRSAIEPLPAPMRFSDGRIRMATVRLRLLQRLWHVYGRAESREALAAYRGGDLLDVGAFHGWYSVLLAPRAAAGDRFVSFEPDPTALPKLTATLRDLGRIFHSLELPVVVEPVGDGSPVAVQRPAGDGGHPRFGPAADGDAGASLTVDAYVATHGVRPRLVKVDVEGAELAVLAGMGKTLAEHRPTVMLEVHDAWLPEGSSSADVDRLMRDAGYRGTTVEENAISHRQLWRPR